MVPNYSISSTAIKDERFISKSSNLEHAFRSKFRSTHIYSTRLLSDNIYNLELLRSNLQTLESISSLEENWNGYQAESIPGEIVSKVKSIIRKLEFQPKIFPTARKSIQLEYEKENEDYLEFEIYDNKIICYKEINGREEEMDINVNDLPDIIHHFYAF